MTYKYDKKWNFAKDAAKNFTLKDKEDLIRSDWENYVETEDKLLQEAFDLRHGFKKTSHDDEGADDV